MNDDDLRKFAEQLAHDLIAAAEKDFSLQLADALEQKASELIDEGFLRCMAAIRDLAESPEEIAFAKKFFANENTDWDEFDPEEAP